MQPNPRWEQWLYGSHDRAELHAWARSLRYFRFCRAAGGHANDGDQLLVALRAETDSSVIAVVEALGLTLAPVDPDAPTPRPGVAYTSTEYAAFVKRIDHMPDARQPGHVSVFGEPAFVWVRRDRLTIALHDHVDPYAVTASTVDSALRIEERLGPVADLVIDPPMTTEHCVSPGHYPRIWAGT